MKRRLAHQRKDGMNIRKKLLKLGHKAEGCENRNPSESWEGSDLLDFEPVSFLRCHSRNKKDSADVSTQVWQCSFEPDSEDSNKNTDFVATCGGNSVCIIDVTTGEVIRKYCSDKIREMFYALSWTTLIGEGSCSNTNILAVGGAMGTILFIHPDTDTMFFEHKLFSKNYKGKKFISGLLFSTNQPSILFCSTNEGQVFILNIGHPFPPKYKTPITLLHTLEASSELFALSLSCDLNFLLAAGNEGLYGWQMPPEITSSLTKRSVFKFNFPASQAATDSATSLVDSVTAMEGNVVATKCALHGCIYIWDLKATLKDGRKGKTDEYKVTPTKTLSWSDTDNYFMNMGYSKDLLACGDDKGAIWIYDVTTSDDTTEDDLVKPTAMLEWPEVEDMYIVNKRKLSLDVYDIVVDKVAVDSRGSYLVAVTANNMVCIWKRCHLD